MLNVIALAALLLADTAPARSLGPLICGSALPYYQGGSIAWINLVVDGDNGATLSNNLHMNFSGFEADWSLDNSDLKSNAAVERFVYSLRLPASAHYPVTVRIEGDGRDLGTTTFGAADNEFGVFITRPMIDNIFGTRKLTMRVTDADDREIAVTDVPMPDWAWVEREGRLAEIRSEQWRREGRCGPLVVDSDFPRPGGQL